MNPKTRFAAPCLLIALTFLAYLPALRDGFIQWDDSDYVVDNPGLRDLPGLRRIWIEPQSQWQYYPLVFTSFWVEYHLWQASPLGYHFNNIALQALAAVLLWRLLTKLELPDSAAWLAAAIFAVHPVEVESVAWISERKNLLCGVFYLSAMLVYLEHKPGTYWAALVLFVGAMFSKTVASTWPVAVLILIWWETGRIRLRDCLSLVPFAVIGLAMGLLTAHLESQHVGAVGNPWALTPVDRCIIAGRAIWFYAAKALIPIQLAFIYPKWNLHDARWVQLCVAFAAAALLLGLFLLRRTIGRAPAAAGWLFAITLLPALGFVNVYPMRYTYVSDHYQYLAIIALIVPAAYLADRWLRKWSLLLVMPLAILTWQLCGVYRNPITLWTDTVSKNPSSWMTHVNLGQALEAAGFTDRAFEQYQEANSVDPAEEQTWWKLGTFEAAHNQLLQAQSAFQQAVQLDPDDSHARYDLATVLLSPNRPGGPDQAAAAKQLTWIVQHDPTAVRPRVDLGWIMLNTGHRGQAQQLFLQAIAIAPGYTPAIDGLTASRGPPASDR